jgi:hypothetical protein
MVFTINTGFISGKKGTLDQAKRKVKNYFHVHDNVGYESFLEGLSYSMKSYYAIMFSADVLF